MTGLDWWAILLGLAGSVLAVYCMGEWDGYRNRSSEVARARVWVSHHPCTGAGDGSKKVVAPQEAA